MFNSIHQFNDSSYQALQSVVDFGFQYNFFQLYRLLNKFVFTGLGCQHPMPNPQPGGPVCLSLSGTSFLTCPAWETLPVATLPPA
jgi:hypothetical protein